jgi:hypothetical protein
MVQLTAMTDVSIFLARPYEHERDKLAVTEMCKDVYGGTDYLPRLLPSFAANILCKPIVLALESDGAGSREPGVVAFANVRKMHADTLHDKPSPFFLEAVRVNSTLYRCGLGRRVVNAAVKMVSPESGEDAEIVGVTLAENEAMMRIFRSQRELKQATC